MLLKTAPFLIGLLACDCSHTIDTIDQGYAHIKNLQPQIAPDAAFVQQFTKQIIVLAEVGASHKIFTTSEGRHYWYASTIQDRMQDVEYYNEAFYRAKGDFFSEEYDYLIYSIRAKKITTQEPLCTEMFQDYLADGEFDTQRDLIKITESCAPIYPKGLYTKLTNDPCASYDPTFLSAAHCLTLEERSFIKKRYLMHLQRELDHL